MEDSVKCYTKLSGVVDKINEAKKEVEELDALLSKLEKKSIAVYDHYKKFKNVDIDKYFIFGPYKYKRCQVINMAGELRNSFCTNTNMYEYVNDNDWVIELD